MSVSLSGARLAQNRSRPSSAQAANYNRAVVNYKRTIMRTSQKSKYVAKGNLARGLGSSKVRTSDGNLEPRYRFHLQKVRRRKKAGAHPHHGVRHRVTEKGLVRPGEERYFRNASLDLAVTGQVALPNTSKNNGKNTEKKRLKVRRRKAKTRSNGTRHLVVSTKSHSHTATRRRSHPQSPTTIQDRQAYRRTSKKVNAESHCMITAESLGNRFVIDFICSWHTSWVSRCLSKQLFDRFVFRS